MTKRFVQHLGDDQLVYGMPKHMVGVSTKESLARWQEKWAREAAEKEQEAEPERGKHYWTVHPKPDACDVCKGMEGIVFTEEPERPHPNCRCRIEKHDKPPVDAQWTFDGSMFCLKNGKCWPAVSGPLKKGALPPGVYTITGNAVAIGKDDPRYCDEKGNCWWVPIEADFDAGGRGHFGIHPDGGDAGTQGCIGLTNRDTNDAYHALKNAKGQKIYVK